MSSETHSDWLGLSEAAALLGVHPSTLRLWADRGDVPAHRTNGRHRRFRRADIEALAAVRSEARPLSGQLVVQHALGRTRMQLAEGRLRQADWYRRLDEPRRHAFREAGRRLLSALLRYLDDESEAALAEGVEIGREYERLGRAAGLSLTEKVRMYQYFRDFLYDSVVDVYQAIGQRIPREWARMHHRLSAFTNAVLIAVVEAHEQAERPG
ncbi:MAG: helix-turn-helix domain-containing protein [Anaerolineales bacterium]|nr:helix-turn-helix domain-containing protein [Anaerolineales bacterium]